MAPSVKKLALTNDPALQRKLLRAGRPQFSHHKSLPVEINIRPAKRWWCRDRISIKTREPIWYRDLLVEIEIPAGRSSDLGSVPPFLWWLLSPWDIALESLFHDEGYRQQPRGIERREWDNLLLKMMKLRGKPWAIRWLVYLGVRIGGGKSWWDNARRKARKERVLAAGARRGK